MRNLLRLLVALAAVLFACSACVASFTPTAASVNGSSISDSELTSALTSIGAHADLTCSITGNGSIALRGAGSHTYSTGVAASLLTTLIDSVILREAEQRAGLAPSAFSDGIGRSQVESGFTPTSGSTCTANGAVVLSELPSTFQRAFVSFAESRANLDAQLAGVALSPAGLTQYASAHPDTTNSLCVSAIESPTKQASLAIQKAAQAGASFASLAKAHSTDQSSAANGGALGCVLAQQFATALQPIVEKLKTGVVSDPVSFGSDYLLLLVTSTKPASDAVIASVIEQAEDHTLNTKISSLFKKAAVEVNPAYGTWIDKAGVFEVTGPTSSARNFAPNLPALTPTK